MRMPMRNTSFSIEAPGRSTVRLAAAALLIGLLLGCSASVKLPPMPPLPPAEPAPRQPAPATAAIEPPASVPAPAPVPAPTVPQPAVLSNTQLAEVMTGIALRPRGTGEVSARLLHFGNSQSGVPLLALRFSSDPSIDAGHRTSVMLIGQQHGDEPAGAQALVTLARQIADGRFADELRKIDVVIVPRLNPDGAARATPGNAEGVDIDRDHLLLQSSEAQALATLVREQDPAVVVDLREYDASPAKWKRFAATPAADVLVQYAAAPNVPPLITRAAEEWFRRPLADALARDRLQWDWFLTPLPGDGSGAVGMGSVQPDSERNVNGLRNSVSLLIAARAPDQDAAGVVRRAAALQSATASILASTAGRSEDLLKLRGYVREEVARLACRGQIILQARPSRAEHRLAMIDGQSGARRMVTIDLDSTLKLETVRQLPRPCGYWLGAGAADAVRRLRLLGVQVQQLHAQASVLGSPLQRDTGAAAAAEPADALVDMPAGSYYLSLAQPLANLAVAALEPGTPYGYEAHRLLASPGQAARLRGALPAGSEGTAGGPAGLP